MNNKITPFHIGFLATFVSPFVIWYLINRLIRIFPATTSTGGEWLVLVVMMIIGALVIGVFSGFIASFISQKVRIHDLFTKKWKGLISKRQRISFLVIFSIFICWLLFLIIVIYSF